MKHVFLATLAALSVASTAHATDFDAAARKFLTEQVGAWASDPQLVAAVRAQNERTAGMAQSEIDALDQTWRAEVGVAGSAVIEPVLNNPVAEFLRSQAAASDGAITEILLMDAVGLNVAVSDITSDFWQGDEAKYSETYLVGPGAVHISEIEMDESSQRYQAQLSFTLTDPATGEAVGAVTVGVDAERLM